MLHLELVALVVRDYDAAIRFFVDVLQFELVEDTPSLTNDGRPKRWVVIRPDGGQTAILLARADGDQQNKHCGPAVAPVTGTDRCGPGGSATLQRSATVVAACRIARRGGVC
jgi:catechol 2,3-dioxygenase-like lactoylglutathione lyase family enzyme